MLAIRALLCALGTKGLIDQHLVQLLIWHCFYTKLSHLYNIVYTHKLSHIYMTLFLHTNCHIYIYDIVFTQKLSHYTKY